jgi:hypothetical protein
MLSPAPSFRRIISTVMRVPATTGLPSMVAGSDVIFGLFVGYLRNA